MQRNTGPLGIWRAMGDQEERARSRSPRIQHSQFSPGRYRSSVFEKFGRSSSSSFADRFGTEEAMDVDKGDDSWSLKEMVSKTHTAVKKLTDRNAERFVGRYDELCVLKTGIDELERGGGRAHDLFCRGCS